MIESKTIKERIENLPPIFKQRIENLSKIHPAILDYEISFCEQAIKIISYVEKRMECELSKTIITSDEYKSYFPLREEMILWQISRRSPEEQKNLTPEISEELYATSLMMARLYFSNHKDDIVTLLPGICFFI